MKKKLLVLSFFFIFTLNVFSQTESENKTSEDTELLQQYQTFSWKKVAKAKKYGISIEQDNGSGSWKEVVSEEVTDNRTEILLYPGNYRVAISVFNALGRKTSTTDWTPFVILNETQPYLFADSLKKSEAWKSPLLIVKQEGSTTIEETDDEGSIVAREGDPTNSLFLKGKNIFFPSTTFTLVPKATSTEGRSFEAFVDLREEVPLEIIRRDTENSGVVVAYNSDALFSGYYDIVAKNPGGQTAQLELLVFSDEAPVIDKSTFLYNENYKVHTINVDKAGNAKLTIKGTGFGNNTRFSLTPESGFIPYPFESGQDRVEVNLILESHKCLDKNGTILLTFNLPVYQVFTGYYKFTADNESMGSDSLLLLVTTTSIAEREPDITKLKTKPSKAADSITYNVMGNNINADTKFTLISSYSDEEDMNKRYEVNYVTSKRRGTLHILSGESKGVQPGTYALLVENSDSFSVIYVEVNESQDFKVCELTESESKQMFLRPADKAQVDDFFIESSFEVWSTKFKYKQVLPVFMSSLGFNGGLVNDFTSDADVTANVYINILNFNWLRWDVGGNIYLFKKWGTQGYQYGTDLFLEMPTFFFKGYVGAGYYKNWKNTNLIEEPSFIRNTTIPISVGFKFANFMDFRYTVSIENFEKPRENWFVTDTFSIGANIPLSRYKYNRKPLGYSARITENETVDGAVYELKKVYALDVDGRTVTGFNGNNNLQYVTIENHVEEIGFKAFADCGSLEKVTLEYGVKTISSKAFENDTTLFDIVIPPTVRTIEAGAFDGWDADQKIKLNWSSDDETPRNLEGLKGITPQVYYSDGVLFNTGSQSANVNNSASVSSL